MHIYKYIYIYNNTYILLRTESKNKKKIEIRMSVLDSERSESTFFYLFNLE